MYTSGGVGIRSEASPPAKRTPRCCDPLDDISSACFLGHTCVLGGGVGRMRRDYPRQQRA
eukprot:5139811-Pyramimonas_sp.AAC.1